jgi:hypothetical protein
MKYFYDTEFIEDGKTIDLISIGVVAEDGRSYYAISTEFNPRRASQWVKENVLAHLPERRVNLSDVSVSPRMKEDSLAWKSRKQIRADLLSFIGDDPRPEFWAYYADYDHVALCQLFGTMMDLPKGWPMYTRDIKQLCVSVGNPKLPEQGKGEHHALADARWNRQAHEFLAARVHPVDDARVEKIRERQAQRKARALPRIGPRIPDDWQAVYDIDELLSLLPQLSSSGPCACGHPKSQHEAFSDHDECSGCRGLDDPCSEFHRSAPAVSSSERRCGECGMPSYLTGDAAEASKMIRDLLEGEALTAIEPYLEDLERAAEACVFPAPGASDADAESLLVITRDGIPRTDQKAALEEFKAACRSGASSMPLGREGERSSCHEMKPSTVTPSEAGPARVIRMSMEELHDSIGMEDDDGPLTQRELDFLWEQLETAGPVFRKRVIDALTVPPTEATQPAVEARNLLPDPLVQARQIVGAWRAVQDGNNDSLLVRYIRQAIEDNRADVAPAEAREVERLRDERDQFFRELGETQEKLISVLALIDVVTSDDPGNAIIKMRQLQSKTRTNTINECIEKLNALSTLPFDATLYIRRDDAVAALEALAENGD